MKAAIFDLDGTLINTEPRNVAIWERLFVNNDVPYDDALLRRFMGRRGKDVLSEMLGLFPGRSVPDLIAEVFTYEEHPGLPAIVPVPGAVELVRRVVEHGSPIAVVTSAGRRWAEGRLREVGVRDYVQTLVTAEDVEIGKPDPSGFLMGAALLSTLPGRCVVFEDSVAGIAAAKAAGMTCVGVATTHPHVELTGADLVVADFTTVEWPPGPSGDGPR
ncbi:HAD family phosphatase [Spongiactinospora sp. TRM90649]|uniref:HAD family hydrolase n=1 Tax=Spongiactinospora sp. TRM90649 TaxID=3031114 RepID=UPI0023F9D5A7|nr:HAD family phosphatase [Spongiactinospora sp. TRM90649]MDF5751131.1 HAD family phosphatase [Spongiactinospora sp. TRM90649]